MSIPVSALQNLIDLKTPDTEIQWRDGQKQHGGDCTKQYGRCTQPHAQLAYIDARYVMGVLDALCGPENWQRLHKPGPGDTVLGGIALNIEGVGWVEKWDGAGETDIEGEKGAVSDSFKRAAVNWNIGRDLYAMKPTSGQPPASRPAPVSAQAGAGSTVRAGVSSQQWDADDMAEFMGEADESTCPLHKKAWRTNSRGYYCATKLSDGSWCKAQPSKAWQAAHEK